MTVVAGGGSRLVLRKTHVGPLLDTTGRQLKTDFFSDHYWCGAHPFKTVNLLKFEARIP